MRVGPASRRAPLRFNVRLCPMSPTIFRDGSLRFYFFSREEPRMHVHVKGPDGEAKFWMDPTIELAGNYGLSERQVKAALKSIQEHEDEIREAWATHFS
jgi:hypothetical protein